MTRSKFSATNWQKQIYLDGFAGHRPKVNIDLSKLEEAEQANMSVQAYADMAGGAGNESTVVSNRQAFEKYKIVPRMLCNVGERNTEVEIFGTKLPSPFLLSPVGV